MYRNSLFLIFFSLMIVSCNTTENKLMADVYETSASGNKLTKVSGFTPEKNSSIIKLDPDQKFQKITGFGGSFTEASASLLNRLSKDKRDTVIQAYFSENGANYSLTRTHMNSCDFSLSQYSYSPVEDDIHLEHFTIKEDQEDLIPMIKDALKVSKDGFKIIASPWTAAPWMKDNNAWVGGKLLPKYYDTWALFFSKYINAYKKEGIDIWGFTVENEPLGNNSNWESMHFSPDEMTNFVQNHLGPRLEKDTHQVKILGFDQNREDLKEWVDSMYQSEASSNYFDGTAIHWYASTYEVYSKELLYAHYKAPSKYLIQTEACIDSQIPVWKDDAWYWRKEATDWGFDWAQEKDKHLHPKYAPVNRYARDMIGCLNNWVDGWVDWNMVLDTQGGPNWAKNWCIAPIIVDPEKDEIYYTPLYYVMKHFSKHIRPGAQVLEVNQTDGDLMVTAAENEDGSIVVVVFNEGGQPRSFDLNMDGTERLIAIDAQALQTIVIEPKQ